MKRWQKNEKIKKVISIVLCAVFLTQQAGMITIAGDLGVSEENAVIADTKVSADSLVFDEAENPLPLRERPQIIVKYKDITLAGEVVESLTEGLKERRFKRYCPAEAIKN